jgi:HSP20 family protein
MQMYINTCFKEVREMATLVRWEPFRELASFQHEMSRLMNGLVEGPSRETTQAWVPALDVWETESELHYAFDLPGVPEDKISVEIHDDTLTISAEREKASETKGERFYRFERRYGTFSRAVGLPQGSDSSKIVADYTDGVLSITVPKPAEAKPRRIQIGSQVPDLEGSLAAV